MRAVLVLPLGLATLLGACGDGLQIGSVEPDRGSVAGDEEIRIHGGGFREGVLYTVRFGGKRATSVTRDGNSVLVATTPQSDKTAQVDVTVETSDGHRLVAKKGFTYLAPDWNPLDTLGGRTGRRRTKRLSQ